MVRCAVNLVSTSLVAVLVATDYAFYCSLFNLERIYQWRSVSHGSHRGRILPRACRARSPIVVERNDGDHSGYDNHTAAQSIENRP